MTRNILARVLAGGVALAAAGCGGVDPAADTGPPGTAATRTTVTDATVPADASTSAEWSTCRNSAAGLTVRYPAGWHTAALRAADGCRWFDPEPFELVDGTDCCPRALEVHPVREAFDRVLRGYTDARFYRVVAHEEVTGERRASRLWLETTGDGLLAEGTKIYAHLLERGEATLVVQTSAAAGERRYDEWVRIVDAVARTVELTGRRGGRGTVTVFFGNERLQRSSDSCGEVFPRERAVAEGLSPEERLAAALEQLLAGPRDAERSAGYTSWFSRKTAGALRAAAILDGGVVRVDLDDLSQLLNGASTSCGSAYLLAALNRTVSAAAPGAEPVYSFRGDCAAFYEWLQGSPPACAPVPEHARRR